MKDAVRPGFCRTKIIAVKESAGQVEKMILIKTFFSIEQHADMDDIHLIGARKPAGVGHFHFAVRSVTGDNNRLNFLWHAMFLCMKIKSSVAFAMPLLMC